MYCTWLNGKDELKATAPAYYNQLNYNSNLFFLFSVRVFFLERVTRFREIVKLKFSTKNVSEVFSMKARSGQNCIIIFFPLGELIWWVPAINILSVCNYFRVQWVFLTFPRVTIFFSFQELLFMYRHYYYTSLKLFFSIAILRLRISVLWTL